MKHRRKLKLMDVNDVPIGGSETEIDVTNIPHANTQLAMTIVVLEQCDMNHWHRTNTIAIEPWGE